MTSEILLEECNQHREINSNNKSYIVKVILLYISWTLGGDFKLFQVPSWHADYDL